LIQEDHEFFEDLYKSIYLFGAPLEKENELTFISGGPLGNVILFGMLTAHAGKK